MQRLHCAVIIVDLQIIFIIIMSKLYGHIFQPTLVNILQYINFHFLKYSLSIFEQAAEILTTSDAKLKAQLSCDAFKIIHEYEETKNKVL
jgi:hypothetical protein